MSVPTVQKFKVQSREDLAQGVMGLSFEAADGAPPFGFMPGQWVMLHVYGTEGQLDGKAAYSIASSPEESKDKILLAIKLREGFTRRIKDLRAGDIVGIQGPFGAFTPRDSDTPLVMLAGGIGITPLRSMVRAFEKSERPMTLIYSNRDRASLTFEKELRESAARNPHFHLIFVLTGEAPQDWAGEKGRIGDALLADCIVPHAEYLACGPVSFVRDMKALLLARGVDITTKFKQEIF
ncbi:MAG: FAD-dependent oxidoreductase [Patescibacteria group bacterium]